METSHSSLSKQRNIRYMDEEFTAPVVREGFVAPRTKEAGIFDCMADPSL